MPVTLQIADWREPLTTESTTPALTPSSGPSATATKEKRLKLRASCDACAASKIRCSKEHPTCARCSANKSECVYGVSRKHGKAGRKRKRNPDGTPFIKAEKRRPSSATNQALKPELQTRPQIPQSELKTAPGWVSRWPPSMSLPETPACEFKAASEQMYITNVDCFNTNCTNNGFLPMVQPEPEPCQTIDPYFFPHDPFMSSQLMQLHSPNLHAPEDYATNNLATPKSYPSIDIAAMSPFESFSSPSQSTLYSPTNHAVRQSRPIMASSLSIPPHPSSYGYNLAGSTFDSTVSWGGALLPSPISDSVCSSSSPSVSGIVSPFMMLDVQHDAASSIYMQPWHFSGCEFDGGNGDVGNA